MDLTNLQLIKNDSICLSYYPPTADLRIINEITYHILSLLKCGKNIQEILESYKEKEKILSSIQFISALDKNADVKSTESSNRKIIDRITLHIANDCNLRCRYCFAGGGNYGQSRGLMTKQTAEYFVDFCINRFEKVKKIMFFGGEPMLNVEVMKIVCNRFKHYYEKGKIAYLPKFVIITNGTILTPSIIDFIKKNIFSITVSIDGPQKINDANRIYQNGKGSYEQITQFIHTISRECNVRMQYEATFTQSHIDNHYTYEDIAKSLKNEFGIEGVVVNEKGLGIKHLLDFWNSVDYEYLKRTELEYLPEDFWRILYCIANNRTNNMCHIIDKSFAVGTNGAIYACQMINGIENCRLGNINGLNIYNSPTLYRPLDSEVKFKDNETCRKCWAQRLCGGCAVQKFFDNKLNKFATIPNFDICDTVRLCIEKILLVIASIYKDTKLWSISVQKMKEH